MGRVKTRVSTGKDEQMNNLLEVYRLPKDPKGSLIPKGVENIKGISVK